MILFASRATPGHREKLFLPAATVMSANSGTTLWSTLGGRIGALTVRVLLSIVILLTLGSLLAFVVCRVLLSIKDDRSPMPRPRKTGVVTNA